jgi:hypothetical protein
MDVVERGIDKRVLINPQADWNNLLNRPTLPIVRYNSTEYWIAHGDSVPEAGAIIIFYDAYHYEDQDIPGIKVGNGVTYLNNLPFINSASSAQIEQEIEQLTQEVEELTETVQEHTADSTLHVSDEDRERWDNKVSVMASSTDNEELILTTAIGL